MGTWAPFDRRFATLSGPKSGRPKKNKVRAVPSFNDELKHLKLSKPTVIEAQHVSFLEVK
jgi:hypothetical protein